MSLSNRLLDHGLETGNYYCRNCGALMEFEDETRSVLVCPCCGYDVDLDRYGFDSDEEYDSLFPTLEELEED